MGEYSVEHIVEHKVEADSAEEAREKSEQYMKGKMRRASFKRLALFDSAIASSE